MELETITQDIDLLFFFYLMTQGFPRGPSHHPSPDIDHLSVVARLTGKWDFFWFFLAEM